MRRPTHITNLEHYARLSAAFNLGCQARLDGRPLEANPFDGIDQAGTQSRAVYWRGGWRDVDRYWGVAAKWQVVPLPPVQEATPAV